MRASVLESAIRFVLTSTSVFRVATINVTGILNSDSQTATSNNAGCGGKTMTVKLFASGVQQRLGTSSASENLVSFTVPKFNDPSGSLATTGATGVTAIATNTSTNTDVQITIPMNAATIINATTVDRVAIETA